MARRGLGKVPETVRAQFGRPVGSPGGARTELRKLGLEPPAVEPMPWHAPGLTRAGRVMAFLEFLPITKGMLAGSRMRLLPDQRDFVERVYAEDQAVQIGVLSEPRGNGKTGLVAGLALCHLLGPEAEDRGEVYSASIDRDMASIIHAEMSAMILAVPAFAGRCNIQRFHKKIEVLSGMGIGSVYTAMSADSRRGHGMAPSLWIYDELAQAKDGVLLGNLKTAMGKRWRSLGLVISTQAEDDEHALSLLIDDGLSGADPSIVVQLLAAEPEADPFDEATIRSVNPALGIFLDERVVFAEAEQARRRPQWEPKFRNLRLNQRIDADTDQRLALAGDWRRCEASIDIERLAGRRCIGGLDLSAKHDLTAFVLVFPDDEPETGYDILSYFWTPEGQLSARPPAEEERMRQWIRAGHVEAHPGPIIRYRAVAEKIAGLARRFDLQTIAYDRWRIEDLQNDLAELEIELPLEPFGQGHAKIMAPSIEFFTECLLTSRLRHGSNPALTASVLNAVVVMDKAGNPMLDKSRSRRAVARIDGAVALVMALGTARRFVGEHVEGRVSYSA